MESTQVKISRVLKELGVSPNLSGYVYIREAVAAVMDDSTLMHRGITKRLYPMIAKKCDTTPHRVERAIRHAVELAFLRGNSEFMHEVFRNVVSPVSGKATNSEFIACVADYIMLENIEADKEE